MTPPIDANGFKIHAGFLDRSSQEMMVADIRDVLRSAPLVQPVTPSGKTMSVRLSAAGRFGWITDHQGYRYSATHPLGSAWPDIPESVLHVWRSVSGSLSMPECCLINWYAPDARMGIHQDKDETDFSAPVVSISLGDDGLFRMGGSERQDKTSSIWLRSGDVVVMGGAARLKYHGIDRIKPNTSTLLNAPGRINLTLRVVT